MKTFNETFNNAPGFVGQPTHGGIVSRLPVAFGQLGSFLPLSFFVWARSYSFPTRSI